MFTTQDQEPLVALFIHSNHSSLCSLTSSILLSFDVKKISEYITDKPTKALSGAGNDLLDKGFITWRRNDLTGKRCP